MTRTREENAEDLAHEDREHQRRLDQIAFDVGLTPEQLDDRYNPHGGGEHPIFRRQDWREDVANDNTLAGYWLWVASRLSMEHDEEKARSQAA